MKTAAVPLPFLFPSLPAVPRIGLRLGLAFLLLPCLFGPSLAAEEVKNGGFEETDPRRVPTAWEVSEGPERIAVQEGAGIDGSRALRLQPPSDRFIQVTQPLGRVEPGVSVLVECRVRCDSLAGYAGMWLIGDGRGDYAQSDLGRVRGSGDWRTVSVHLIPTRACSLLLKLGSKGPGTVWFDEVRVRLGAEADRRLAEGPADRSVAAWGVFHVLGRYRITVRKTSRDPFVLDVPLPPVLDGQAPLCFSIAADPAAALVDWKPVHRLGPNWIARVRFRGSPGEDIRLRVDAKVLATFRDYDAFDPNVRLSRYASASAIPEEVRAWRKPSRIVQSDDSGIRRIAAKLRAGNRTVGEYLEDLRSEVEVVFGRHEGKPYATRWDAVTALKAPVGCCGNANLIAALLRAGGIPARSLAGFPLRSGPLMNHYVVEYWVPGFGWSIFESSTLFDRRHPCEQIQMCQVAVEDENASRERAGAGLSANWFGIPAFSTLELPPGEPLRDPSYVLAGEIAEEPGPADGSCTHEARHELRFDRGVPVERQRTLVVRAADRWRMRLAAGTAAALSDDAELRGAGSLEQLEGALPEPARGRDAGR